MKKDTVRTGGRAAAATRKISADDLSDLFLSVGEKLRKGQSAEAEKILTRTISSYDHSPDNIANLRRLLAFTLETTGRYRESLEAIREFEDEDALAKLTTENQVRVTTQLAIAYNNLTDQPKAITLLKDTLAKAQAAELRHLYGAVDIALARV